MGRKNIIINPKKVVDSMIKRGIAVENIKADEFENWSDTLLDSLEALYELETEIKAEFCER